MTTASVIIPVYNRAAVTRQCLRSLLDGPSLETTDFEVIVVDDASTDLTNTMLAAYQDRIQVVRHAKNAGFATACNDGAAVAAGRYLVFLNNDTIPQRGWLDTLTDYLDANSGVAAAGGKLLFTDGRVQHAGVTIGVDRFPWHLYAGFPGEHPAVNTSRRVQIVTGACMAIRREIFEELGGFDASFQNGYEDVDLCLRIAELGHAIYYCHTSVLYHLEALTRESRADELDRNLSLYRSRWLDRVVPDDLNFYVADGLLNAEYRGVYPVELTVAPELATVNATAHDEQLARLLDLQRENTRLAARIQEQEFRSLPQSGVSVPDPRLLFRGALPATDNFISIVLCVKDAADRLQKLLPRIFQQNSEHAVEIVAIDQGSSDDTARILGESGATVITVGRGDFTSGSLMNLACRYVQGSPIVFLDQDALPADDEWLVHLIAPLAKDARLAGVCSRVVPAPDADVLTRRDGLRDSKASTSRTVRRIDDWNAYRVLNHQQAHEFVRFHTLSAAIRPQALQRIPFLEPATLGEEEEVLWAKDILEAGWSLQFEPASLVFRSPDEPLPLDTQTSLIELIRDDWRFLQSEEAALSGEDLEHWRLMAAARRTAQVLGKHGAGVASR